MLPAIQRLYDCVSPAAGVGHPYAQRVTDLLDARGFYVAVMDLVFGLENLA